MVIRKLSWFIAALLVVGSVAGAVAQHRVIRGKAHYYSDALSGNAMACGGTYEPWKMVAAHRTLPCGTRLRVKNRANGKVVTVTVRDRGPFGDDAYVLDVSRRAAKLLGFYSAGSARIRAAVLHD
ncbi:MAG: septal ring lytic transglycosylase RlpA family protein [Actinomycetota bacterium]|nr:septal ring lytic transglycosylase RlpA family protein [Actinomycetota bacterium]